MRDHDIRLELKWIAGHDAGRTIDPELFALLQVIKATGKLTIATAEAGLHYRQAWGLINRWSGILGQPLVIAEQGKGTQLSPLGEKLVFIQERIDARLAPHLESAASEVEDELGALLDGESAALHIYASHDLALADLRDHLRTERLRPGLDLRFASSLDAVVALCKARCEISGFHLPDGSLGERVARTYLPWLKPRTQRLTHFIRRTQGLIVRKGNPLGVRGIEDIVGTGARYLNRQRGSGTRLALDQMLQERGIEKTEVNGYYTEEFTHLAVAAAVAGGVADVALGLEAAARKLGMDFIPLFSEVYYLLAKRETLEDHRLVELSGVLSSPAFQGIASKHAGYDAREAGVVRTLAEAVPGLGAEDTSPAAAPRAVAQGA